MRVVNTAHVWKRCRSPLPTSRPDQFLIEDHDAPCAVLQVNDTGPNANRKAPPPPPRQSPYLCLSQLAVPSRTGEGYNVNALCARCCMLRAVSTKTLPSVFCSFSSSSARGLSARPRSRTQDAPPYITSILPHAERTRKYPYCIPLAVPRFRHPDPPEHDVIPSSLCRLTCC
ncbi:hypothetical protein BC826DRAFT_521743 [Russula brevipes]|nr:hypothetical protein BC826DRAFT_521743 [Russula brevipes]